MISVPPPETPERENFNRQVIGYLVASRPTCEECAVDAILENALTGVLESNFSVVDVYGINIAPYSFSCIKCKKLVVDGIKKRNGEPLNLFED